MELELEYVSTESLKPYEKNARKHGRDDLQAIITSIQQFGFNDPIGVWHDVIVEGHGRWLAAKEMGMTEVPIIRLDQLSDEQRKAYALAHNKTAELSGWDFDVLATELKSISEFDMSQFGFDLAAIGGVERIRRCRRTASRKSLRKSQKRRPATFTAWENIISYAETPQSRRQ